MKKSVPDDFISTYIRSKEKNEVKNVILYYVCTEDFSIFKMPSKPRQILY